jgi:DNA-binding winged helix-turn-helix (wHTH) protein/TolB-like protein/Tfp pilus assembly protein PilF
MSSVEKPTYVFEGFTLDAQRRVLSRADGEPILLAPKALDTLLYFVEHRGELVDKRTLLDAIWPNVVVEENNLSQCISTLRRVLGERPTEHRFIVTEPGRGFRFVSPVSVLGDQEPPVPEVPASAKAIEPRAASAKAIETPPARAAANRWPAWYVFAPAVLLAFAFVWFWQSRPAIPPPPAETQATTAAAAQPVLPNSVAVLPFADESTDPSKPWIATGLHIEVINKLGQLGLNVINREAVLKYLETTAPSYAEIAADLRVQSILVGTIRYADDKIRVEASLVDPATGRNLWPSPVYERDLLDVFEAEAAIATNVATALNAEFSVAEQRRIETRPTVSLDAAQSYYQALTALQRNASRNEALRLFRQATDRDPNFSLAHAQLALLLARSPIDWGLDRASEFAHTELEQEVRARAQKALDLDESSTSASAIAHTALGMLNMHFWRWTDAKSEFARAYELSPNDKDVLVFYAEFETFSGDYAAALPMAERLVSLNPTLQDLHASGSGSLYSLWLAHVYAGNTDKAIEYLNQHLGLQPRHLPARAQLGFVQARLGNYAAAEEAFDDAEQLGAGLRAPMGAANTAYGYGRIGEGEKAKRLFDEIQNSGGTVSDSTWALAHLAIGDRARSLEHLDRAIEKIKRHEPDAGWFNIMMFKHNLTGDPTLDEPEFRQRREQIAGT